MKKWTFAEITDKAELNGTITGYSAIKRLEKSAKTIDYIFLIKKYEPKKDEPEYSPIPILAKSHSFELKEFIAVTPSLFCAQSIKTLVDPKSDYDSLNLVVSHLGLGFLPEKSRIKAQKKRYKELSLFKELLGKDSYEIFKTGEKAD